MDCVHFIHSFIHFWLGSHSFSFGFSFFGHDLYVNGAINATVTNAGAIAIARSHCLQFHFVISLEAAQTQPN